MPDTKSFFDAIRSGDRARVRSLLDADPSLAAARNESGASPLLLTIYTVQNLDTARYLAEKGANIHVAATNGTGYNALTAAVTAGHTEVVKYLLEGGLDPNYRYGAGYTPLLAAAANGHLEIVKLLLGAGADPASTADDGKSALVIATERNHPHLADFLRSRAASAC